MKQGIKDSLVTADMEDKTDLEIPETAPCYRTAASILSYQTFI